MKLNIIRKRNKCFIYLHDVQKYYYQVLYYLKKNIQISLNGCPESFVDIYNKGMEIYLYKYIIE